MKKSTRHTMRSLLAFVLLFFAASPVFVLAGSKSEEINEKYRSIAEEMKEAYIRGNLHLVIRLYNDKCCKQGVDAEKIKTGKEKGEFQKVKKEIRADIYEPLVQSFFALNRPELGEIYLRKILVFRRDEGTDKYWLPIREAAKNKYYVAPRLLIGIKTGTNFTFMHPGERYAVMELASETGWEAYQKDYGFHLAHSRGMHAGFIIEYAFTKNLSVSVQPTISSRKFQYKSTFTREDETGETDTTTLNYTHHHNLGYLEIPFLFKYRFLNKKIKPYIQVGAYFGLLQSAIKTLDAVSLPDEEYKEEAIVDIKQQFTGFNFGLWLGAGIGYDTRVFRFEIETNYKFGLNNIVDKGKRFENEQLMFAFYDVFDDMKSRNWALSLKVMLPVSFKAFRR